MQYSALSVVEGYWNGLYEQAGHVPRRADVNPRGMELALEYAVLLERVAPGIARVRLAGLHLTDLMGMEVRGMPLTALFLPAARETVAQAIEAVCSENRLAELELRAAGGPGRDQLHARLFMAPLLAEDGRTTRILACLQTRGQIGRTPRRFDHALLRTRALSAAKKVDTARAAVRQVAFAEAAAPFTPPVDAKRHQEIRRGHLRLVYSAD